MYFMQNSLSLILGAQTVHLVYRPMDDIDQYVQEELKRIAAETQQASEGNEKKTPI